MHRKAPLSVAAVLLALATVVLFPRASHGQTLRLMSIQPVEAFETGSNLFAGHQGKAAVVVNSDIRNLRFVSQGSPILEVREEAGSGRYVLIVEPLVQEFKSILVDAPDYATSQFRHPLLAPGQISYWEINATRAVRILESVQFNLQPVDAKLYIDGKIQPETDGPVKVPSGLRTIRVEREGYRTSTSTRLISADRSEITIALVPEQRPSEVPTQAPALEQAPTAAPTAASAHVPARAPSEAPTQAPALEQAPTAASAHVPAQVPSEAPTQAPAEASAQGVNRIRFDMDEELGSLVYSVVPSFATTVLYDNSGSLVREWIGFATVENLEAGFYTISSSARNYATYQHRIQIRNGETTEVSVDLNRTKAVPSEDAEDASVARTRQLNPWSGLVLPGSSHLLGGRKRGWLYLAGTLGAGTAAYLQWRRHQDWAGIHDTRKAAFDASGTPEARTALNEAKAKRDDFHMRTERALYAAAGIHGVSMIDLSLTRRHVKKARIAASLTLLPPPAAVSLPRIPVGGTLSVDLISASERAATRR